MGGWEELPCDLINAICQRLETYVDHIRLGAVCASWYSAVPKRPTHLFKQIPWLMLPFDDKTQTHCLSFYHSFYSILDDKVYHLDLSETRGKEKWIRGSSHGWLVIAESPALYLFNPLTKVQIALPPIYTFPDIRWYSSYNTGGEYAVINCQRGETFYWSQARLQETYIHKLVLSSSPLDDYLALAIYGEFRQLAFCRRNDKKWTAAKMGFCCLQDVIFYENKIYVVDDHAMVLVSGMSSLPNFTLIPVQHNRTMWMISLFYLVGSSKGLMLVARHYETDNDELEVPRPDVCSYQTTGFRVYLLESNQWSQIANLGGELIFIGYNASVLISSIDSPRPKGNCIYYTDTQAELWEDDYGGFDNGIFDLEEERIKGFEELHLHSQLVCPPPIWVMPDP
ncbi:hypothetical protein SLE2022_359400 [Rubroshorea leprosula]